MRDILAAGPSFSFEFFPPKTEEAERQLETALRELEPLGPSFVSVTYGAGGSTRERTHDLVVRINAGTSMTAMAHLTCAAHSRAELVGIVERYRDEGIENILALRGDVPKELGLPPGELAHAVDLVDLIREVGDFSVGVAAHPEKHPDSPDLGSDRRHLAEKLARADFAITQFFFEAHHYFETVETLQTLGVDHPVLPGIMPVTNISQVARMASLAGADFPTWLEDRLRAVEDDPAAMREVGVAAATDLCGELLAGGAPGLHFYTLNRSRATRDIYARLGLPAASSAAG
ncbi:MAG: methylenetetrahydrofolate reductase [NAD(P)H] [Acidimicrobiia bacterium]|nr:methylenetetrahydrofolate reductase [NAD(P)H] [Acidimicrobiia bacterium]